MISSRIATCTILSCLIAALVAGADEPEKRQETQAASPAFLVEFRRLKSEYDISIQKRFEKFEMDSSGIKTTDERERLLKSVRSDSEAIINPAVQKSFELVQPHATDSAAVEPLVWIATRGRTTDNAQAAAVLLMEHHLTNPQTIDMAFGLRRSDLPWAERLLRAQIAAPDLPEEQKPKQVLALAQTLQSLIEKRPDDAGKVEAEAIQLFTQLGRKYANQEYRGGITFGELAKSSLFEIQNLSVGKVAPDIVGEDLDGQAFKLSDYRGKVVLLSFWASWCGPCMAEVPHERELVQRHANRPFVLLGVNADLEKSSVTPILKQEQITWRSFWCGEKGPFGLIARTWNVNAWPTVYLIDHSGVIRAKTLQDAALEELIVEAEKAMK
ncbi:MAG: hypothetical protein JWM11_6177 [Planctomycetaceae bacterium]|nr:hypothetical protein [Planctomycetaceae bacterium]